MGSLSWESFIKHAKDFIKISTEISDGWELVGDLHDTGNCYLKKIITGPAPGRDELILRWEYHVYYSNSFNVPVLCFNVWKSNGSLLRLEEVWKSCNLRCNNQEEFYSALTQQEHPLLLRPFFTLHPCKTAEILNVHEEECNPIIRYLSAIGPMVNLSLDIKYGTIKTPQNPHEDK